jgi:hypothetical protein
MKTKLMVLALMAGGSMFAATRFSFGVTVGQPAYVAPAYNYGYVAPAYSAPYNYGYDYYTAPSYNVHRDWDHDRDDRSRDRDDRSRVRNDVRGNSHNEWRR